jgi:hypothetical protein
VLGERRRQALADNVRARIERWRKSWIPDHPAQLHAEVSAACEYLSDVRLHDAAYFRVGAGPRPLLVLLVPASGIPQIAGVVGGEVGETASRGGHAQGLADELLLIALRALVREFRTTDALDAAVERLPGSAMDAQRTFGPRRYASARVSIGEAKCCLVLLLSPEFMAAAVPGGGNAVSSERIERRAAAVADQQIGVEAVLGEGEVLLSELTRLAVGDVIVLDRKLGDAASLTVRGGERIAGAAPGRLEALRAVQIKREIT